jgi:hypothetical protein
MDYSYLYIILISIAVLFIVCYLKYNKQTREQFGELNLPSFTKFMKHSTGYNCNRNIDGVPQWVSDKYGVKTFCDKYPDALSLAKLTTNLIPKATHMDKKPFKTLTTKDLHVKSSFSGKVVLKKTSAYLTTAPLVTKKDLLKTEAIEQMKLNPACQYIAVGKNSKIGETLFYAGDKVKMDTKIAKSNSYDLYEKVNTIEYSLATWIKIDSKNGGWRNIIHHGSNNATRGPGVWIYPNQNRIGVGIITDKRRQWGEWTTSNVGFRDIPYKKWCHLVLTVSGNKVKIYINGKLITDRTMSGSAIWPTNQKFFVCDPWHNVGGFHLSKMNWYPFELTTAYVENLAYATFPLEKYDKKLSLVASAKTAKISLLGNWLDAKWNGWHPVELREHKGIVFIDGIIYNPKGDIGSPCFVISDKYAPDRTIKLRVASITHGFGSFLCTIKPNGEVTINDNTTMKAVEYKYLSQSKIVLSGLRYSITRGSPLTLLNGSKVTNNGGHPSLNRVGSTIHLTGHAGNTTHGKVIARLPDNARPLQNMITHATSSDGVLVQLKIYSNGYILPNPRSKNYGKDTKGWTNGSGYNCAAYGKRWCKDGQVRPGKAWAVSSKYKHPDRNCMVCGKDDKVPLDTYLEGISFNIFKGDPIALYNGWRNYHSSWSSARAIIDEGVVKLTGVIVMPDNKPRNWSIKQLGCHRDKSKRDLLQYHGHGYNKETCGKKAKEAGHPYFGTQWYGQCFSGNIYNSHGKATNCNTKCHNPSSKNEICGGGWANTVYSLNHQWDYIGKLPDKYKPEFNTAAICGASNGGFATIMISTKGALYLFNKGIPGKTPLISLDNISYLI